MNQRSISEIRNDAVKAVAAKVGNKTALFSALPLLLELQEAVKTAKRIYDNAKDVYDELNELCSDYAVDHPSIFDGGELTVSPKGVRSGDICIDDIVYHFSSGYGSPVRLDGETLTQEFLSELPDDWAKAVFKIDTTGINRLGVTDAQLEEHGLYRPAKNSWSQASAVL